MDDSFSSVTSLETRSETTLSSECSDMDIPSLQGEILKQSQAIESFIQNPGATGRSPMAVLKSLFRLFKSELALNITLRKKIVAEKKANQKRLLEVQKFFDAISDLGFRDSSSFGDIVNVVNDLVTSLKKEVNKRKRATAIATETHQKNEALIHKHSREVSEFQARISEILEDKQALVAQYNSALKEKKNAEKDNIELCGNHQLALDEKERMIEELQCDIRRRQNQKAVLREDIDTLKKQLKEARAEAEAARADLSLALEENERLKTDNRAQERLLLETKEKMESSEVFWKKQVEALREENEELKQKIQDQLEADRIKSEEAEQRWSDEVQKQREDIKRLTRRCDKKSANIQTMRRHVSDLQEMVSQVKAQLARSQDDLSTAKSTGENLQAKVADLETQLAEKDEHNKKLKFRMRETSKDARRRMETAERRVQSEWQVRLDEEERKRTAMEASLRESGCEIQSLKDMIRKLSFNLEREEADNARLHAQLQMQTAPCDRSRRRKHHRE